MANGWTTGRRICAKRPRDTAKGSRGLGWYRAHGPGPARNEHDPTQNRKRGQNAASPTYEDA